LDKKILRIGLWSLVVVIAAVTLILFFTKPASFRGTTYGEPYPPATEFELTRSNGAPFRLIDQRGKIVLLFFGFTNCTDVCPTTLAELNQALNEIGEKANSVQVVLITVDPDRDSPKIIQEYVGRFNPSFIGLSGSLDQLAIIWQEYGVFREVIPAASASAGGYEVNHTARVTVIDINGNLRLSYPLETPVADIVHDLELLLK